LSTCPLDAGQASDAEGQEGGSGGAGTLGRAVQVLPIKPKLKLPRPQRLKLTCDILLSTSAFKLNLRRYTWGSFRSPGGPSPAPMTYNDFTGEIIFVILAWSGRLNTHYVIDYVQRLFSSTELSSINMRRASHDLRWISSIIKYTLGVAALLPPPAPLPRRKTPHCPQRHPGSRTHSSRRRRAHLGFQLNRLPQHRTLPRRAPSGAGPPPPPPPPRTRVPRQRKTSDFVRRKFS